MKRTIFGLEVTIYNNAQNYDDSGTFVSHREAKDPGYGKASCWHRCQKLDLTVVIIMPTCYL